MQYDLKKFLPLIWIFLGRRYPKLEVSPDSYPEPWNKFLISNITYSRMHRVSERYFVAGSYKSWISEYRHRKLVFRISSTKVSRHKFMYLHFTCEEWSTNSWTDMFIEKVSDITDHQTCFPHSLNRQMKRRISVFPKTGAPRAPKESLVLLVIHGWDKKFKWDLFVN